jgi:hypothetical protein
MMHLKTGLAAGPAETKGSPGGSLGRQRRPALATAVD